MTKETETFLILKYGSMDRALTLWLTTAVVMNEDETITLRAYGRTKFPNLALIRKNT